MARIGHISAVLAIGLTTALLSGCGRSYTQVQWEPDGRPQHTHHHEHWWNYQFVYHPHEQVYFEPYSRTYYWFENGMWHEGPELPQYITPDPQHAQVVKLKANRPHAQHDTVVSGFGPHRARMHPATPFPEEEAVIAVATAHPDAD